MQKSFLSTLTIFQNGLYLRFKCLKSKCCCPASPPSSPELPIVTGGGFVGTGEGQPAAGIPVERICQTCKDIIPHDFPPKLGVRPDLCAKCLELTPLGKAIRANDRFLKRQGSASEIVKSRKPRMAAIISSDTIMQSMPTAYKRGSFRSPTPKLALPADNKDFLSIYAVHTSYVSDDGSHPLLQIKYNIDPVFGDFIPVERVIVHGGKPLKYEDICKCLDAWANSAPMRMKKQIAKEILNYFSIPVNVDDARKIDSISSSDPNKAGLIIAEFNAKVAPTRVITLNNDVKISLAGLISIMICAEIGPERAPTSGKLERAFARSLIQLIRTRVPNPFSEALKNYPSSISYSPTLQRTGGKPIMRALITGRKTLDNTKRQEIEISQDTTDEASKGIDLLPASSHSSSRRSGERLGDIALPDRRVILRSFGHVLWRELRHNRIPQDILHVAAERAGIKYSGEIDVSMLIELLEHLYAIDTRYNFMLQVNKSGIINTIQRRGLEDLDSAIVIKIAH